MRVASPAAGMIASMSSSLNIYSLLYVFAALLLNVLAQYFAKLLSGSDFFSLRVLMNLNFWMMSISFVSSLAFWLLALKNLPLSIAHPIFASGVLLVQVVSYLLLKETVNPLALTLLSVGYVSIAAATFISFTNS